MGQASKHMYSCKTSRPGPYCNVFTSGCLGQRVKVTLEWPPHKEAVPTIDLQITMKKGPDMLYAFNTSTRVKKLEVSLFNIESSKLAGATQ